MVEDIFGLNTGHWLGGSIHFFIYDVIKIFILLSVLIFGISYVQSFFFPERTRKILGRYNGISANILGALLGTVTPFCSCSFYSNVAGKHFINAGSAGKLKHGNANATYVIVDVAGGKISPEIIEVPYHVDKIAEVIEQSNMFDKKLIDMLRKGY